MFWLGEGSRDARVRQRLSAALGLVGLILATGVLVAMSILIALGTIVRALS
jgi:hypothetical protein